MSVAPTAVPASAGDLERPCQGPTAESQTLGMGTRPSGDAHEPENH